MSIITKCIIFQLCILLPFFIGFAVQGRFRDPRKFTNSILRLNIIGLEPVIVFWCVWGLNISPDLLLLPVAGLGLVLVGLAAGALTLPLLHLNKKKRYTYLISATLANHGFTMGGFLCYLFMGEQGLGLSVIMVLYFIPYVFGLIFPLIKTLTGRRTPGEHLLKDIIFDLRNLPLLAMLLALALKSMGYERPDLAIPVDPLLICSISLYYLTLGINFTRIDLKGLLSQHSYMACIKFLVVPLTAYILLQLFQVAPVLQAVILIQACMPVAIYSVVTSVLFELDTRLASSLLVCNTLIFLVLILPAMFLLRGWLVG